MLETKSKSDLDPSHLLGPNLLNVLPHTYRRPHQSLRSMIHALLILKTDGTTLAFREQDRRPHRGLTHSVVHVVQQGCNRWIR